MATNPVYFAYYDSGNTLVNMTDNMDIQNCGLNQANVYQTWTDGNWEDHRDVVRTRVSGSVKLGFASEANFNTFLTSIAAAELEDGTVKIKAYVNNVKTVCEFYAFVDIEGAGKWDLTNSRQWQVLTVKVSEK